MIEAGIEAGADVAIQIVTGKDIGAGGGQR